MTKDERNTPAKMARPLSRPLHALFTAIEMLFGADSQRVRNDLYQSWYMSPMENSFLVFFCPLEGSMMGLIRE